MPTIKCEIKRNKFLGEKAGRVLFLKPLKYNTMQMDDFVHEVSATRNLSEGQIRAVLTSAAEVLATRLSYGHSVHIDGMGTFSLAMKGGVQPDAKGVLQVKNARVSGVNFLCDRRMQDYMGPVKFKLTSHFVHDMLALDEAAAMEMANRLMEGGQVFTRSQFAEAAGASYSYATKVLVELVEKGLISESNIGRTIVYKAVERADVTE